jgi:HEAT repeat protein
MLGSEDKYARRNAALALGRIGPEARTAVQALARALKDKDQDVRQEAAASLGHMGPEGKAAVPVLVELLNDEHKAVRKQAAGALKALDPETAARHLGYWSRLRRWFERPPIQDRR